MCLLLFNIKSNSEKALLVQTWYVWLFLCIRAGFSVGYLKRQDVPMVIVSHDREFLDQLCTKIVETERGITTTFKGNYTQYVMLKRERLAQQWSAWEKQTKELQRYEFVEGLVW